VLNEKLILSCATYAKHILMEIRTLIEKLNVCESTQI